MKLKQYLERKNIDYKDAAKELDLHAVYFNTIVNGAKPGPKLAMEIERWSNGEVPKSDLRPDLWPESESNAA